MPTPVPVAIVNRTKLTGTYNYKIMPRATSLRVAELLPGHDGNGIVCKIYTSDRESIPEYEVISYAWRDLKLKAPVFCDKKTIVSEKSLHTLLSHLRYPDKSRLVRVDALCMNQGDILERDLQVKQTKRLYKNARKVQVSLGADTEDTQAEERIDTIKKIDDFLCGKLDISMNHHVVGDAIYQELLLKKSAELPLPNKFDFSTDYTWKLLVRFYSHSYFTCV